MSAPDSTPPGVHPATPASAPAPAPDPAPGPTPARPLRADARRNRENLLAVARAAFAADGATVALESIAREADVGIGTLYRHFPTREALVEAVYAAELEDVTTSAHRLLDELPPAEALRAWMDRYADFVAAKHGMIDSLRDGWAAGRITPPTRQRITAEVSRILAAGAQAGTLRADVAPEDVTAMLLGAVLVTATSDDREQTGRLLDLVTDALRPGARPQEP